MDWLSQNWIWIALAIGAFFLMTRMGGCGMGRSTRRSSGTEQGGSLPSAESGPRATFDPVSKHSVAVGSAISSVYQDRAYYFENREDRDAFEANPEKYISGLPAAGQAIGSEDAYRQRPRRRGGC